MLVDEGVLRRESAGWPWSATWRTFASRRRSTCCWRRASPAPRRRASRPRMGVGRGSGVPPRRGAPPLVPRTDVVLDHVLAGLVRKELIRPERSQAAGEDAFRFRHLLIREAAYEAVPKQHADCAIASPAAFSRSGAIRFVGYRLERPPVPQRASPRRATDRSSRAALGVSWRRPDPRRRSCDVPAAVKLLSRGTSLLREDSGPSPETLIELGSVLVDAADLAQGDAAFAEAMQVARIRRMTSWPRGRRSSARISCGRWTRATTRAACSRTRARQSRSSRRRATTSASPPR